MLLASFLIHKKGSRPALKFLVLDIVERNRVVGKFDKIMFTITL